MKQTIKLMTLLSLMTIYSCSKSQNFKEFSADTAVNQDLLKEEPTQSRNEILIVERKIIKEGEISFETANAKATKLLILNAVSDYKGYISNDKSFDYKDKIEYKITIRIPSDNFDLLLNKISESAEKLDNKTINALDVTEEFIDIEARLKTKKELENRYTELLKQAKKVEELLSIEREIGSLRTEIESIEGRLKYMKDKISFSTLTVTFYEKTSSAFGFKSKFGLAIKNGWSNLLWFLIGLTNLWPFFLIGLTVFLIIIQYNKIKIKKNAP